MNQGEAFEESTAALAWRWALVIAGEGQAPLDGGRLECLEGVLGEGVLVQPAQDELTASEDRDPFVGTPWHKHVPARVERV